MSPETQSIRRINSEPIFNSERPTVGISSSSLHVVDPNRNENQTSSTIFNGSEGLTPIPTGVVSENAESNTTPQSLTEMFPEEPEDDTLSTATEDATVFSSSDRYSDASSDIYSDDVDSDVYSDASSDVDLQRTVNYVVVRADFNKDKIKSRIFNDSVTAAAGVLACLYVSYFSAGQAFSKQNQDNLFAQASHFFISGISMIAVYAIAKVNGERIFRYVDGLNKLKEDQIN